MEKQYCKISLNGPINGHHWKVLASVYVPQQQNNECVNSFSIEVCLNVEFFLLKPVLGGVQLPLPSMNRLNHTEPATFSINVVGLSLWVLFFSVFCHFLHLTIFAMFQVKQEMVYIKVLSVFSWVPLQFNLLIYIDILVLIAARARY